MASLFLLLVLVCYGKYIFIGLALLAVLYGVYLQG